ncbi:MAG: SusE domain-containing protein [Prevotella sp.]|nr:SusE domain-containing protein [Prevotella sp.]
MKTFNHILRAGLMVCAVAAALTSCNKDPEYFELPSYPDEMHVKSSVESIILNKGIANDVAVTLTWDKATSPISADDKVTYKVCLYPSATKDLKSDYIETEETQLQLTHDQLNSMMARWALPGEAIKVTAQVLSVVSNETRYVKPEVSTVEFTMTGYEKYPQYLYMVMTDEGGNVFTETLEQRQLGTGIYEVTFNVAPCTFHFTSNPDEPYPVYGMLSSGDGQKMEYVTEGEYTEFTTDVLGEYTVIVDTNTEYNDCRLVQIVQLPMPGHMWIVGDGCSVGWNPNNSQGMFQMVGGLREPWIYAWTGEFFPPHDGTEGTFKIGLETDYGGKFFFAPANNTDPTQNKAVDGPRNQGGDDNKWLVPESAKGVHTIKLYLLADDLHLEFE